MSKESIVINLKSYLKNNITEADAESTLRILYGDEYSLDFKVAASIAFMDREINLLEMHLEHTKNIFKAFKNYE